MSGGEDPPAAGGPTTRELIEEFGPLTLDILRGAFPEWRFTEVDGQTWAFRAGVYADDGAEALIRQCVRSADLLVLTCELAEQERLRAMTQAELAVTYRQLAEGRP